MKIRLLTLAVGVIMLGLWTGCTPVLIDSQTRDPKTGHLSQHSHWDWQAMDFSSPAQPTAADYCWHNERTGGCYPTSRDCQSASVMLPGTTNCYQR